MTLISPSRRRSASLHNGRERLHGGPNSHYKSEKKVGEVAAALVVVVVGDKIKRHPDMRATHTNRVPLQASAKENRYCLFRAKSNGRSRHTQTAMDRTKTTKRNNEV